MELNYTITQYKPIIIPCKPVMKNIKVHLIRDGVKSNLQIFDYNAILGFHLFSLNLNDTGYYKCIAENDTNNAIRFHIQVIPPNFNKQTNRNLKKYVLQGQSFQLYCNVGNSSYSWTLPNNNVAEKESRAIYNTTNVNMSVLNIANADRNKDQGEYICNVEFDQKILQSVFIVNRNEKYIEMKMIKELYSYPEKSASVTWIISYESNYNTKFIWLDNKKKEIILSSYSTKYVMNKKEKYISLQINNVTISDFGVYTLKPINSKFNQEFQIELIVLDKPMISTHSVMVKEGKEVELICNCSSYPPSKIWWSYSECNEDIFQNKCLNLNSNLINSTEIKTISPTLQQAIFKFKTNFNSIGECIGNNDEGSESKEFYVLFKDLDESMEIWISNDNSVITVDDAPSLTCGAINYNVTEDLVWYRYGELLQNNSEIVIIRNDTKYSIRSVIYFNSIKQEHAGIYECRTVINNSKLVQKIYIWVHEPMKAELRESNFHNTLELSLHESLILKCIFVGYPIPDITWFKNNHSLVNNTRISIHNNNTILEINSIVKEDVGNYECRGTNRLGYAYDDVLLQVKIKSNNMILEVVIAFTSIVLIMFFSIVIYMAFRIQKLKKISSDMNKLLIGCADQINPDLPLEEQADLLPYIQKFEFPQDRLKLGQKLGEGNFGIVFKAIAYNIEPNEDKTIVAVKTIKGKADGEMRSFISELKIMIHVGQHLNIVNVLGAITKNIENREMMIITEYCRFGNLHNFLLKCRGQFVDQINSVTDEIDHKISTEKQTERYDTRCSNETGSMAYQNISQLECSFECNTRPESEASDREVPTTNSNYKDDEIGTEYMIKTSDLVNWGYQVACGMVYLSSRRILHGDLAARNVLLDDNNIVKICDFGLARSLYQENYTKKEKCQLPFKWLAVESIQYQVFSQYSDVWSFGIFLWELFSLGKVPYPGMSPDFHLFNKLLNGYRMEKPDFANQKIYNLMLNCWSFKPELRPLFSEIVTFLQKMLEADVKNKYILLNEPYVEMNAQRFLNGTPDYLAMMPHSTKSVKMERLYVNDQINLRAVETNSNDLLPTILNNLDDDENKSSINNPPIELQKC